MSGKQFSIIHFPSESSPFIVANKNAGIPSAPLFDGDDSVLTGLLKDFPEIALVRGKKEVEHGLVHRIDTESGGLILIATTQESYDSLIQSQMAGMFEKWYAAEVDLISDCAKRLGSFPPSPHPLPGQESFSVESFFRPFGKKGREVRPVTGESCRSAMKKSGAVPYKTDISLIGGGRVLCHIKSGFRHQVRCHLSWCSMPVRGDLIYNPDARDKAHGENPHDMRFTACKISFPHPLTHETQVFQT